MHRNFCENELRSLGGVIIPILIPTFMINLKLKPDDSLTTDHAIKYYLYIYIFNLAPNISYNAIKTH
jgi:hypothetical protein